MGGPNSTFLVEGDEGAFETNRKRVIEIAMLLEEKAAIPAVAAQLEYIAAVQESAFWEGISVAGLEELRLRGLVPYHLTHIVIHRLRTNQPLTGDDLKSLERTLVEIGEEDGETLLSDLLARSEAPSLAHFVRSLVGMDRSAAYAAFSQFLNDRSLTPQQIRFVEMVIDQLTTRGIMDASALYEPPFSDLHAGGPDELFAGKENVINNVFQTLASLQPHVPGLAG